MADERLDGLFMTGVNQSQGIDNFFDNLFSFMCRKTDLFTQEAKAYELVNKYLTKHMSVFKKNVEEQQAIAKKRAEEKAKAEELAKQKQKENEKEKEDDDAQVKELTKEEIELLEKEEEMKKANPAAAAELERKDKEGEKDEEKKGDDDGEEEGEKKDKKKGQKPNSGNGGQTDKYYWEQTIDELTVNVNIPPGIKAKMLTVDISQSGLKLGLKGQTPIIDGEWHKSVKVDDCLWSIERKKDGTASVQLNLTKREGMQWWDCVIKGDPEIDTQSVNPENSKLSDLDGETRGVVEKMMFDQQQKQKGLPTSEEMEKKNKLKAFMDAHPEMDFSNCKFN